MYPDLNKKLKMVKIDKIELKNKIVYFIFSKNLKIASYREKSPLLIPHCQYFK